MRNMARAIMRNDAEFWLVLTRFTLLLVFVLMVGIFGAITLAHAETWKKDTYGYETWRSDKGEVWKRDRYGNETWRSNSGKVCEKQTYGGGFRCN